MPQKKGGKKKNGKDSESNEKRQITIKGEMEEYGKIMKNLGDRRLIVILPDSSEILARIPGRFRKRCWISIGDIVLINRRDFQEDKVDIIHKYNNDETTKLLKKGEIPAFFLDAEATRDEDVDFSITIEEENKDDEIDFDTI